MAKEPTLKTDTYTRKKLPKGVDCRGPEQYRARKMVDGKSVSRTFNTANEAKKWLEETHASIVYGDFEAKYSADMNITLGQLLDRWTDKFKVDRAYDIKSHMPSIRNDRISLLRLCYLTKSAVRNFRDRQREKHSDSTAVKRLNFLASIINFSMSEWDFNFKENPASASSVKRPDGYDKKRERRINSDEETIIVKALSKSPYPDDVLFFKFALYQGCRRGEIESLTWNMVDLQRKVLILHKTKNDKHRKTWANEERPLTVESYNLLKEMAQTRKTNSDDKIFNIHNGNAFSQRWSNAMRRARLNNLHFHDVRHEATSKLARIYKNPLILKVITGHMDLKSLDRYYNPTAEEIAMDYHL